MACAARAEIDALCAGAASAAAEDLFARRDAFAACLGNGALLAVINEEIATLVAHPAWVPARSAPMIWTLTSGSACTLRLIRLPQQDADNGLLLHGSFCHRLVALVSPGAVASLDVYRHSHGNFADFDPANALQPAQTLQLRQGEVLLLRAWQDVAEWQPQPRRLISVALVSRPVYDQCWIYERASRRPCELVSSTFHLNRLQYALELLAEIGDATQAAATAALYEHPAHQVRWAALKATLDLDPQRGRELLQRATSDAHPHVARAAAAGLRALAAQEP